MCSSTARDVGPIASRRSRNMCSRSSVSCADAVRKTDDPTDQDSDVLLAIDQQLAECA